MRMAGTVPWGLVGFAKVQTGWQLLTAFGKVKGASELFSKDATTASINKAAWECEVFLFQVCLLSEVG